MHAVSQRASHCMLGCADNDVGALYPSFTLISLMRWLQLLFIILKIIACSTWYFVWHDVSSSFVLFQWNPFLFLFLYRGADRKKAKCTIFLFFNNLGGLFLYISAAITQQLLQAMFLIGSNWGTVMSTAVGAITCQSEALFTEKNKTYSCHSKPTNNLFPYSLVGN